MDMNASGHNKQRPDKCDETDVFMADMEHPFDRLQSKHVIRHRDGSQ